jgi:hypothetical protein
LRMCEIVSFFHICYASRLKEYIPSFIKTDVSTGVGLYCPL